MRRYLLPFALPLAFFVACSSSSDSGEKPLASVVAPARMGICSGTPPADALAAQRTACAFAAGARVDATLGIDAAKRKAIPIRHVIVVMKENRSYDEIFGQLALAGQPESEPVPPGITNTGPDGVAVPRFHETNSCVKSDPAHQWSEMHAMVNGGKMDGFVKSAAKTASGPGKDGRFVMGYFDQGDLPFYYFLANTYAIGDRHFPSILSGTWPNRDFLLFATNDGVKFTGDGFPTVPSIFDSLDAAQVSWTAYGDGAPLEFTTGWLPGHAGTAKMGMFYAALADGTLPAVSFVDSRSPIEDEHPPGDMQVGEAWTRSVYQAVTESPLWASTALIFTYDEAGGFYDHVPPPLSCVPTAKDVASTELGVRVPLIVVSPYARHHYVSHVQHEHTSITRFIETLFDLPALTARDANSDALLDMFDFDCAPTELLPAAPAAGTGACNYGSAGAGGAGGAGGSGGTGGGKGSECAQKPTKAECASCCDADFPLGKLKLSLNVLSGCGCTAQAACASVCSSSCPSGPAAPTCQSCLDGVITKPDPCAASALAACDIDSDCSQGAACGKTCSPLP